MGLFCDRFILFFGYNLARMLEVKKICFLDFVSKQCI